MVLGVLGGGLGECWEGDRFSALMSRGLGGSSEGLGVGCRGWCGVGSTYWDVQ